MARPTQGGANGGGTVSELSPSGSDGPSRSLRIFPAGSAPQAGLIIDSAGIKWRHRWRRHVLSRSLRAVTVGQWLDHQQHFTVSPTNRFDFGPVGNLVMDYSGNLDGATYSLGSQRRATSSKFRPSGNGWTYTHSSLYWRQRWLRSDRRYRHRCQRTCTARPRAGAAGWA